MAIAYDDFEKVEIRVGVIVAVDPFPEARKPAYKLEIDFGGDIGVKKSSAQITEYYTPQALVGRQVYSRGQFPATPDRPFHVRSADSWCAV